MICPHFVHTVARIAEPLVNIFPLGIKVALPEKTPSPNSVLLHFGQIRL
jgi:hypothetical protein